MTTWLSATCPYIVMISTRCWPPAHPLISLALLSVLPTPSGSGERALTQLKVSRLVICVQELTYHSPYMPYFRCSGLEIVWMGTLIKCVPTQKLQSIGTFGSLESIIHDCCCHIVCLTQLFVVGACERDRNIDIELLPLRFQVVVVTDMMRVLRDFLPDWDFAESTEKSACSPWKTSRLIQLNDGMKSEILCTFFLTFCTQKETKFCGRANWPLVLWRCGTKDLDFRELVCWEIIFWKWQVRDL
jgi:hypothetical protein